MGFAADAGAADRGRNRADGPFGPRGKDRGPRERWFAESTAGTTGTLAAPLVYRLVVRIPAAQLGRVPPSTDSGSGSSGSSGTGGTSGTTGAGGAG